MDPVQPTQKLDASIEAPVHAADPSDPSGLAELLASRLAEVYASPVRIVELHRLTGGASRETWSFEAHTAESAHRLVLRRDPPGADRAEGMALEAASIAAAERAGVPVPHLVDHRADAATLGAPYLITRHVDGETIPRRLLRDARFAAVRPRLAVEFGRTLARVHRIPLSEVPDAVGRDPLEHLRATYDEVGEPLPSVEIALHWLDRHRLAEVPETLVHGDFRNGNMIVSGRGVEAVLDWERVHRGDPREDLGWLCVKCWRFGEAATVGGYGPVEDLLDGYADVAGTRPDAEAVRWWQVYGTARWAVGCRGMAERHLSGAIPSVELIAIGRRVCEQEHDLLLALGHPAGDATAGAAPSSDLHGRPTSAELLDAVATYLREDVVTGTEGRVRFHARVAANVVDTVAREISMGPAMEHRHRQRLAAFGCSDTAELAAAIRAGLVDWADPALVRAVRDDVTDRLRVANPRYASHPG